VTDLKKCECNTKYAPQVTIVRIPQTFKAMAYIVFCCGDCHREGVGMTREAAESAWNETFSEVKP
jgi:hypothetical protein